MHFGHVNGFSIFFSTTGDEDAKVSLLSEALCPQGENTSLHRLWKLGRLHGIRDALGAQSAQKGAELGPSGDEK